jgi:ubiquinone/menaquinone biosynthesis C-methylase UbiE
MRSDIYGLMYERQDAFWLNQGIKKITSSLLDKYLAKKTGNKILDIGCGPGGMFLTLAAYGEVYGADISENAIFYARKKNIAKELVLAPANDLPFADNTFDVVAYFDLLYHQWIQDDNVALKEINRVLAPGGTIIIKEAAYDWLRSHHDQLNLTRHRFSKSELADKIERSGFSIHKISYIIFFIFPLALAKRLLEKIFPEKDSTENFLKTNIILSRIFKSALFLEAKLITAVNFPFGLSVIGVASKNK